MGIFEKLSKRHVGLPLTLLFLYVSFIASLIFEYHFKFIPSHLCLAQRYCTAVCIACVTIAFLTRNKIHMRFIDFSCISLFWGIGFSGYHLLIQYKIFPEPNLFRKAFPVNASLEEIGTIVKANEAASCVNIAPSIFSIPTSAFTFVMFVFLFIYLSFCFKSKSYHSQDHRNS